MSVAIINPALLAWSRKRASLTQEKVATALAIRLERVVEWESGNEKPTFKQAQKWAAVTHTPFGYLFLKQPPQESLPIPDLRTMAGAGLSKPSIDLQETIKDVLKKQDWFKEYLLDQGGTPLSFVGKFKTTDTVAAVVSDIRKTLGFTNPLVHPSQDEYFRTLISTAEDAGVLVMRSGIVGSNIHRKLDVAEFRGFAISDPIVPVVFINGADAPTARLFTLLHELAHLWIGSSGISNVDSRAGRREEAFCNRIAGEFLVPETTIRSDWNSQTEAWTDNLAELASKFKVSKLVIAKRASDLELITEATYAQYYYQELEKHRANRKSKAESGGDYYANIGAKNSKRFSQAVVAAALSGRMLLRDAGNLLGVQPSKITTFAGRLGI